MDFLGLAVDMGALGLAAMGAMGAMVVIMVAVVVMAITITVDKIVNWKFVTV